MEKLPPKMSGFTIVQLSDMHIEVFNNPKRTAAMVDMVNALNPDLVVITGDLIDGNVLKEPQFCLQLKRLNPKYGTLAITGNHDYYGGIETFYGLAACSGIKILKNESVTIADSIEVAGLDDDEGYRGRGGGPDLDKALKNCDPQKPIILLYHRPLGFDEAIKKGVGLQLSGHTHAGQIPPMDIIVWLYYKYPNGLYKEGHSYIYTTSGTDVWRTPMRFLTRNEIIHITLTAPGQESVGAR
jgi:predicted MPP superfamily phosphohydrolase